MLNVIGAEKARKIQEIAVKETRLGIPLLIGYDIIHGYKTIFPIPLAESSSWDLKLIEQAAHIAATEASAAGVNWTFAPMVDIARDARWGRIAEGAGEDAYLGSLIAKARVSGFQGDYSSNTNILACAKHFVGYGAAEAGLDYNSSDISERTLREVYLPPFKAAADAGAGSFMNAFNSLNGIPATANELLVKQILKKEWNYKGFIVSDYNSIAEMIDHGVAANKKEAAELAANAQCDMDMNSYSYRNELVKLVKEGKVSMDIIDEAVRRILTAKYKLGLFANPYKYGDVKREKTDFLQPESVALARKDGRESIVLLKNENNTLPLSKQIKSIAVIGPLADNQMEMLGCWYAGGESKHVVTVLQGIREAVSQNTKIYYAKGCEINALKQEDFTEALQVSQKADVVVMVAGEYGEWTGEAHSRTDIGLPGNQLQLIKELQKTGKPIIVVLTNGRPLTIDWLAGNVSAIVESWFLGIEAGHSIADVLFGDYNPSGKLTVSFPYHVGQEPLYYNHKSSGRPPQNNNQDVYRLHYMDSPTDALYPFGYGLSYTTFQYTHLAINRPEMNESGKIEVSVEVTNTGKFDGEEVVQLYLHDVVASVSRPVKELKGFEKISLKTGETKQVKFVISIADLKYYNKDMKWTADAGDFDVFVGGNSKELLKRSFHLME
jgi:beta-glucosidase